MSRTDHESWLPTIALILFVGLGLWLARGSLEERREQAEPGAGHHGYFLAYPGRTLIDVPMAYVQSKSVAADRHVSPLEVRVLLQGFAQGSDKIDASVLNKALDERWPMK